MVSSLALTPFLASAASTISGHSFILGMAWNGEDVIFNCARSDWLRMIRGSPDHKFRRSLPVTNNHYGTKNCYWRLSHSVRDYTTHTTVHALMHPCISIFMGFPDSNPPNEFVHVIKT